MSATLSFALDQVTVSLHAARGVFRVASSGIVGGAEGCRYPLQSNSLVSGSRVQSQLAALGADIHTPDGRVARLELRLRAPGQTGIGDLGCEGRYCTR